MTLTLVIADDDIRLDGAVYDTYRILAGGVAADEAGV